MKGLDRIQEEANRLIDTVVPTDPVEEVRTDSEHGEPVDVEPVEDDMASLEEVFGDE